MEFRARQPQGCPAWGLWGGKAGESGGSYLRSAGSGEYRMMPRQPQARAQDPR